MLFLALNQLTLSYFNAGDKLRSFEIKAFYLARDIQPQIGM